MEQVHTEAPKSKDNEAPAITAAKAQQLPVLWNKDAIVEMGDKVQATLQGLDSDVHDLMVQHLLHVKKTRDTSLVRRLMFINITSDSGYRRAAMLAWFRTYSPMEFTTDNVNLSGKDPNTGKERPFRVLDGMKNPFKTDDKFKEQIQSFFSDSIRSTINSKVKEARAAIANLKDGKPIDPTKKMFDGEKPQDVLKALDALEAALALLPKDDTKARRKAEAEARAVGLTVIEGGKKAA